MIIVKFYLCLFVCLPLKLFAKLLIGRTLRSKVTSLVFGKLLVSSPLETQVSHLDAHYYQYHLIVVLFKTMGLVVIVNSNLVNIHCVIFF